MDPFREHGGGYLTGDSVGEMNFQGWDVEGSVDGCLRIVPIGEHR